MSGVQAAGGVPVLLDAENTFNKSFAEKISHLNTKRLIMISSDTLEGCFNKIYTAVRLIRETVPLSKPIGILFDSIAACPSSREWSATAVDFENATQAEIKAVGDLVGDRARTCSKNFRTLPKFLNDNNAALIIINQYRSKIGVMYGSPDTSAGGGRSLEYFASVRLGLSPTHKVKDKHNVVCGTNLNVSCIKNKVHRPFLAASGLQLLFEKGLNPFSGLLELLIQNERIASSSAGNYYVLEPYAEGKEIKFRASKERNDVPYEALLQCPKLVDAESSQQVQRYLDTYGMAVDGSATDIASEETFTDEV